MGGFPLVREGVLITCLPCRRRFGGNSGRVCSARGFGRHLLEAHGYSAYRTWIDHARSWRCGHCSDFHRVLKWHGKDHVLCGGLRVYSRESLAFRPSPVTIEDDNRKESLIVPGALSLPRKGGSE